MLTRRELLARSVGAGGAGLFARRLLVTELDARAAQTSDGRSLAPAFEALDAFVASYLRTMDAPGLTLAIADRRGVLRVAAYGFSDRERRLTVDRDQLFEIGSITKSFVAIAILQLVDEGRLDLHQPIGTLMPWLKVESHFAPITVHHLLSHTSGLPPTLGFRLSDPTAKLHVRYAPGDHFVYCNLGFEALGFLLSQIERRPFADVIRDRILRPLGMTATEPIITGETRLREARSYNAWLDDRPFAVGHALKPAPPLIMDSAAGCIASTAGDMGKYVQMIASGGAADRGRVISERSFAAMTTPYAKAEEFGPGASYGYGIAVDRLDGRKRARHTGGMVSFASALHVDLDRGVGAFASINAMQGYRPNPVAEYAIRLVGAAANGEALPPAPAVITPATVANPRDFAGTFTSPDGATLRFVVEGDALFYVDGSKRLPVDAAGEALVIRDPHLGLWPLNFQRANGPSSPVTDLIQGGTWYAGERYTGPRTFTHPPAWTAYVGHYRNDSPWYGSLRVVQARGSLWLDGVTPLAAAGPDAFWLDEPPYNPARLEFLTRIDGHCSLAKLSGVDFWRVAAE
jgi:CubicO group peptidase (beta-lactamase class C family)